MILKVVPAYLTVIFVIIAQHPWRSRAVFATAAGVINIVVVCAVFTEVKSAPSLGREGEFASISNRYHSSNGGKSGDQSAAGLVLAGSSLLP